MIAGKKYNGLLVDIWSCGVILYAMLVGYLPFEDNDTTELYRKILSGKFEQPDFLSADVIDILKKILDTNPDTRLNVEGIRSHPWYLLVESEKTNEVLMTINNSVIGELSKYGIEEEYAKSCIETNRHNEVTTTYYLLAKKSICDKQLEEEYLPYDNIVTNDIGEYETPHNINKQSLISYYTNKNTERKVKNSYKFPCKSSKINETYTQYTFEQVLKTPKFSKYVRKQSIKTRTINQSAYRDNSLLTNEALNKESPQRSFNSFEIFVEDNKSNERWRKIEEIYQMILNQSFDDYSHEQSKKSNLKISRPLKTNGKERKRESKQIKENSPYNVKLNITVTKSQQEKHYSDKTVRKTRSQVQRKSKQDKFSPTHARSSYRNTHTNHAPYVNEYMTVNKLANNNFKLRKYIVRISNIKNSI